MEKDPLNLSNVLNVKKKQKPIKICDINVNMDNDKEKY